MSETVECPNCGPIDMVEDVDVERKPQAIESDFKCTYCGSTDLRF